MLVSGCPLLANLFITYTLITWALPYTPSVLKRVVFGMNLDQIHSKNDILFGTEGVLRHDQTQSAQDTLAIGPPKMCTFHGIG